MEAVTTFVQSAHRGMAQNFDVTKLGTLTIVARGEVRPTAIAEELDVNPSSVTRQVAALEEEGLVESLLDPSDARARLVRLTDAGAAQLERWAKRGVDTFAEVVADWPAEDLRQLATLLNRLREDWAVRNASRSGRRREEPTTS